MNQTQVIDKVRVLLSKKTRVEQNIRYIKEGEIGRISEMKAKDVSGFEISLVTNNEGWVNKERLWNKMKYLLLAELEETLAEINRDIDSLVTFKEEN